jgi:hypothetical protein
MAIEHACARLAAEFHICADRFDHARMAALFAEDAVFDHLILGPIKGRAAIQAYFDQKDTSSVTCHVTTNFLVDAVDETHATGQCYWTFYGSAPDAKAPVPLKGPLAVGRYDDRYVRTHEGWRFAYRRSEMTFKSDDYGIYKLLRSDIPGRG